MTDRELEIYLAKWLFGCSLRDTDGDGFYAACTIRGVVEHRCPCEPVDMGGPSPASIPFVPQFAQQVADAWQVVEKMRERGYEAVIRTGPEATDNDCAFWLTEELDDKEDFGPDSDESADKMPRAICLAAKAALEAHDP